MSLLEKKEEKTRRIRVNVKKVEEHLEGERPNESVFSRFEAAYSPNRRRRENASSSGFPFESIRNHGQAICPTKTGKGSCASQADSRTSPEETSPIGSPAPTSTGEAAGRHAPRA